MKYYHLKKREWQVIYEYLKIIMWIRKKNKEQLRLFIEGVFFISGCQWRFLLAVYGKWYTVYKRFSRWDSKDVNQQQQDIKKIAVKNNIADEAYDSKDFRYYLEQKNCIHVIPPRKNRKLQYNYDKHIYKERHLIECFFSKIKFFRHIFSRFDKKKAFFSLLLILLLL